MTMDAYQALQAANNAPKSSGARLFGVLPSTDGVSCLPKDVQSSIWQPMCVIGGKKSPGLLGQMFGSSVTRGWPGQTSVQEFAQMNAGDVVAGNLVAPLTPTGGGGGFSLNA